MDAHLFLRRPQGVSINERYLALVEERILWRLLREFRAEYGTTEEPGAEDLEIAWQLQGGIFYYGVRRYGYRTPVQLSKTEMIARRSTCSLPDIARFSTEAAAERGITCVLAARWRQWTLTARALRHQAPIALIYSHLSFPKRQSCCASDGRADCLLCGNRALPSAFPHATAEPRPPMLVRGQTRKGTDGHMQTDSGSGLSRRNLLVAGAATIAGGASPQALPAQAQTRAPDPEPVSLRPVSSSVTLRVNGTEHALQLDTRTTLLDALREHLHLTAPRRAATTASAAPAR